MFISFFLLDSHLHIKDKKNSRRVQVAIISYLSCEEKCLIIPFICLFTFVKYELFYTKDIYKSFLVFYFK